MERLTAKTFDWNGHYMKCADLGWCDRKCGDCPELDRIVHRLAHYEDLEEQGRLVVLPCKVGDTVWAIWAGGVCKAKCSMLTQKADSSWKVRFSVDNGWGSSLDFTPDHIGKTVFLTREEAEAALKE